MITYIDCPGCGNEKIHNTVSLCSTCSVAEQITREFDHQFDLLNDELQGKILVLKNLLKEALPYVKEFPLNEEIARAIGVKDYAPDSRPVSTPPASRHISVQPAWCGFLPLQQQSVLFLASRGPDGMEKYHPCKAVHVAYRASVFLAGKYGRSVRLGEKVDTFMSLDVFGDDGKWNAAVDDFFRYWDNLPAHYVKHLMHGVQILGYKHPDQEFRSKWNALYLRFVEEFHLRAESEFDMDQRLGDWGRKHWENR